MSEMTCALMLLAVVAASLDSSLSSSEVHFSQSVYTVTVNETAPPDHPRPQSGFLTLTCTPNSSYTIHYPTSDLPFEIDPDTGELNATADIDYDSMEEGFELFTFNVSCINAFSNASALALVQVYVAPVNEFLPQIDPSLVLNITEATPSGSLLLSSLPGAKHRLLVQDRDRGPHGQLNFTLLTSLGDHFSFNPIHGNLTLVRAIDFESEPSMFTYVYHELPVKIRVCDRDTDIEACPIIHFPLFIIASDDNEPTFLNASYSATVNESIAVGSSLLTLECSDADVYIGVVRRITFLDPPPDVEQTFSLQRPGGPESVEVVLATELDFDQRNQTYQFQMVCEDFLHTATATVTIHILDVNDNAPKFSNPLHETVVVPDTIASGAVHSVRCTDQDSGENSDIVYEILPQHSLFAVDQTGRVLVNIPLLLPDFTLSQSHNLSIQCRDKGSPSLSSNKTLTLTISKTDSQPPQINISHTSVSVLENSSTGMPVLTFSVYDVDSEAVIIAIASQSLPGTFVVSPSAPYNHPNYPVLIVNGSLDREDRATHLIHLVAISVSTTAQPQNTSFSLNISVEDINDNVPKCREESTVSLSGGEFRSTTILSLSCSDADVGLNQRLAYSLTNTAPPLSNGQFTIDQISGELRLEGVVDKGEYCLTVRVSDMGTPPMTTDVGIQVKVVEVEKGEVASNESGLPLMLIIIIVVVGIVVLVSMVGGCGLCCCCWYISRKRKNKDYFVSGSIGLDGMTVIAAPTAVQGTGSIVSHRLVPLMEDVSTIGNDEVTVTFNQATEVMSTAYFCED
ncbi:Protocadherin Fat 2 [Geodia barretti]|uniref:Protocadherin Fat 2 n=1 Tax=Geodia barretti TaxID=519541 RepID=A0AA35R6C6_GEOBA|nr:Protocadherin Fat 2 [Geodia barretti]